jgi:hypothetical protein
MIKTIRLNKEEVDPFLEGGGRKKGKTAEPVKAAEPAQAPEPVESESTTTDSDDDSVQESDSSSSQSSDSDSVTKSVRSSTLTIDMLAGDPLFVVLSHFLTCSNRGGDDENIVDVLKKISNSLEKIADKYTSSA